MKKILLTIFSLSLAFTISAQGWNYVTSSGTSFILFGMSFPPGQSSIGYACGMQYTYNADGVIVKTTDGGNNWTQVWPASGDIDGLQGIWFINDNIGFAGGWNNYFIRTNDAGITWTPVSCGTNVWYYTDVVFYDANNGVASAYMNSSDQCVFITSDGGNTWTQASSGIATNLMGICYADQNTLYAVSTGAIYKSTDGGHNWTTISGPAGMYFGIDFANPSFGVIGAEEKIFATNDGGATWSTFTTGYENFYATQAFSDGTAYVGGTDENIYVTNNFGASWSIEHNGPGASHLYRIRYTPDGKLTACGSQGTIIQRAPVLTADFSANNTDICENDVVNFTDLSSGAVTSWSWTFEGGNPPTSSSQNPSVTYASSGTFDVTLEISDGNITNTLTKADYITVSAIPGQASTPAGPDEVCGGQTEQYTISPVSGANTYYWVVDPQDAGAITGTGTTGTFTAADDWTGNCVIRVRAENDCGDGAFSPDLSVTILFGPQVFFLEGGGSYCSGTGGLELTLDGSQIGVDYELFLNSISTGTVVAGTGNPISFGFQTAGGAYTSTGYTASCSNGMIGQQFITVLNVPGQAGQPEGPAGVCNNSITNYTTAGSYGAEILTWVLDPAMAGTMTPGEDMVDILWDGTFSGIVTLTVFGSNDCGDGSSSPELEISVNEAPAPEISGLDLVCEDELAEYSTAEYSGNTYSWSVEGGNIVSGAGTNQIAVQWGNYGTGYVNVIEGNGICADTTDNFEVQIDECTAIDEFEVHELRLYPNPASHTITFEGQAGHEGGYQLKLINMHGKIVDNINVSEGIGTMHINVSSYPAGMYLLEVRTRSGFFGGKRFLIIR